MLLRKLHDSLTKTKMRKIIFLFCISFVIRIVSLIPAISFDVALMYDELTFFDRAVAYEKILTELLHAEFPSNSNLWRAYEEGNQPPFFAFLIGLGFFIFGKQIAVARLLMVVISALTTSLVYLLTSRLTTEKAAVIAGLFHAFYPSFIAYSHYLLSETPFIFFLLTVIYFLFYIFEAQIKSKRILYAIFTGLFLGLAGLTRAAVLPFLFFIPLWLLLFLNESRQKLFLTSIVVFSYLIVLLPWQTTLMLKDKNAGFLSSITGWYLHLGNNPWIPDGYGSSWLHDSRGQMLKAAKEYGKSHLLAMDKAHRVLALQEIKHDFKAFLLGAIYKLRMFWSYDFFILQYIFHTAYPPIPNALVVLIWIIVILTLMVLFVFTVSGFIVKGIELPKKILLLALSFAVMAQSAIAFGIPRFHLPLLAVLLPVAGHGVTNLKQNISFKHSIAFTLITILFFISIFTSIPLITSGYLFPSSYYCKLITQVDNLFGSNTICIDKVIFRAKTTYPSEHLLIVTRSNGYLLSMTPGDIWTHLPRSQEYNWEAYAENRILSLDIYAQNTSIPLEISIFSEKLGQSVVIQPIKKTSWRKWQFSGLSGIEYMWLGGGWGVRHKLPDDDLFKFK